MNFYTEELKIKGTVDDWLNEKLLSNISKLEIQSSPDIIKPEKIVDRDHGDALKDKASVLFFSDVFLIIKGNEHTRITIMPIPQRMNAS